MKTLIFTMLLALWAGRLFCQKNEWFIGFAVNPQHSVIFNKNDKIAAENEPSKRVVAKNDNGETVIPNSLRISFVSGYSFSDNFKVESQLSYSYQHQKYLKPPFITGSFFTMKNNFHYAKLSLLPIFQLNLNDVMKMEIGAGPQLSYIVSYLEERVHYPEGSGSTTQTVTATTFKNFLGYESPLTEPIFYQVNLEGRAVFGLSWSYDDKKEYFFRFTADYSLMDIENKSSEVRFRGGNVNYYETYHSPFKWNFGVYPDEKCPDCSSTRPPSYNFTAAISFGMRFYL